MFTPFNDADLDGLATQKIAVVHPTLQELHPSSQGYAANNMYPGFPPLMSDGRALIASWQPEEVENQLLLQSSGIQSNWEYRKYLTHNAKSIMRTNFTEAENDCGYSNLRNESYSAGQFLPIHTSPARYDSFIQPESEHGRFESDLKADYLSREQLAARYVTPVIGQLDSNSRR
jgi:hypothetical protein